MQQLDEPYPLDIRQQDKNDNFVTCNPQIKFMNTGPHENHDVFRHLFRFYFANHEKYNFSRISINIAINGTFSFTNIDACCKYGDVQLIEQFNVWLDVFS